jgi:hypothetical protein
MYMVYWTQTESDDAQPQAREFASEDMSAALKFMEQLRARQRQGDDVCFITMCSENPHSVGHPGAADPGPDYNWKNPRR